MMPSSVFVFCFGNGFETVKGNLIYLLPGTLCMSGYLIIGHYFSGTGQFAKNNIAIAGGLLVTVICFVFLYFNGKHPLSAHEAALITSCSQMATFFSVIWLFKVDTQIHLSDLLPGPNDLIRFSKLIGLNRNK
jgi:O-antigen/teichoic acid export membrane protein